ncbi:MAG: hypothetical protein LDL44_15120 [Caenispirillum sp.]|nr:hypothetical protein [Caenispirillum sp.]
MHAEAQTDNAAWVDINLPQPAQFVADYVRDVERLLRLNPHLEIRRLTAIPGGFALEAMNEMNGLAVSRRLTFRAEGPWRYVLGYDSGLKLATEVEVMPQVAGARLRIRETYREPTDDAELAEVDRSLTPWGQAIRRHFLGLARWGRLPPYRWWRERLWLSLRPRERRILSLFVWITALEFAFFLLVLAVYLAESARA